MFNKKDQTESNVTPAARVDRPDSAGRGQSAVSSGGSAVIGSSIHVDGTLRGEEDLLIEGKVNGTVELKKNSVTIGPTGEVTADVVAHTIFVDGRMDGNLVASERIVIRKSARIKGSLASPRVSLEDGAQFNGSIDMDPETDALKKAFSGSAVGSQSRGNTNEERPDGASPPGPSPKPDAGPKAAAKSN
jgi:cytoskeletal protein CcmA (bactofilin family)